MSGPGKSNKDLVYVVESNLLGLVTEGEFVGSSRAVFYTSSNTNADVDRQDVFTRRNDAT